MSDPAIVFKNVSKRFQKKGQPEPVIALDDVNFEVPKAGIYGIIGRSGAGKSTLLRLVNGLERPTDGDVIVSGIDVGAADKAGLRRLRRSVGMIFQHFNLLSSRTVTENVALPLEIAGTPRAEIRKRVGELVDLVGLSAQRDRFPAELSGGQKQRVGIARALATRPEVLLSDEATSALDPETTRSVLELLGKINRELGLTILFITHEMEVARDLGHHVAVIEAGRLVEQGPVYEVFSNPQHPTTRSFLSGVTGVALPEFVRRHLREAGPGPRVAAITFTGMHATDPVLSRLVTEFGIEVNILAGSVEEIGSKPFGRLIVALDMDAEAEERVAGYLRGHGLAYEPLGHLDTGDGLQALAREAAQNVL